MSVLFGLAFGLQKTPLTSIQVAFSNLICAVTLRFVWAIGKFLVTALLFRTLGVWFWWTHVNSTEPAEDVIMDMPPRKGGKRLIGRYLYLRIMLATLILILVVIGSTFWAKDNGHDLDHQRSCPVAFNVRYFGAISICLSARFSYNSSMHPRLLKGNALCWWSVLIVAVLQIAITYIPGLNSVNFIMAPINLT
jgi:magnesium-transporting ATPase (P-type)